VFFPPTYRGVHILVATPGRLMDMLDKKMVHFISNDSLPVLINIQSFSIG
jgi:superfamily II DNA/RNA helicase